MNKNCFFVLLVIVVFIALPLIMCKQEPQPKSTKDTDLVKISKVNPGAQMEAVMMPHVKHEDEGVKCIVCHHKVNNDDRIKVCSKCHMGEGADKLMHNLCVNCHKEKKKGPTDCTVCHMEKKS